MARSCAFLVKPLLARVFLLARFCSWVTLQRQSFVLIGLYSSKESVAGFSQDKSLVHGVIAFTISLYLRLIFSVYDYSMILME